MKKIVLLIIALAFAFTAAAQQTEVWYINDHKTTKAALKVLPVTLVESADKSVENGVLIYRLKLKKGAEIPAEVLAAEQVAEDEEVVAPKQEMSEAARRAIAERYDQTTVLKTGDKAADFTASKVDGSSVTLSQYRGKVVLLTFWATWCAPCLMELSPKELPAMILERFGPNPDFVFLPVAYTDSKKTLEKFFATPNGEGIYAYLRSMTAMDPNKKVFERYAKSGVPRSFLIDRDGRIVAGSMGRSVSELERLADLIAAELKK